jgi:hypothetical protein
MIKKVELDATKAGVLTINGKRFKARRYTVQGREIELYTTKVLASALGRNPDIVRRWENFGLIPPPLFVIVGGTLEGRRWYSREQIVNLFQVRNHVPFSAAHANLRDKFFALFRAVFDEGEIIDVTTVTLPDVLPVMPAIGDLTRRNFGDITTRRPLDSRGRLTIKGQTGTSGRSPAARNTKPEASRDVVAASLGRYPTHDDTPERRGHFPRADEAPVKSSGGHPASVDSRPESSRPSYRRRPARRA